MKSGRASWQKEEETRKDFCVVLILHAKFFAVGSAIKHSIMNSGLIPERTKIEQRKTDSILHGL